MLGDEDRVIPHRRLLAVVRRIGGGETFLNKLLSVRHHSLQPLAFQVFPFSGTKAEPAAKVGTSSTSRKLHPDRCSSLQLITSAGLVRDLGTTTSSRERRSFPHPTLALSSALGAADNAAPRALSSSYGSPVGQLTRSGHDRTWRGLSSHPTPARIPIPDPHHGSGNPCRDSGCSARVGSRGCTVSTSGASRAAGRGGLLGTRRARSATARRSWRGIPLAYGPEVCAQARLSGGRGRATPPVGIGQPPEEHKHPAAVPAAGHLIDLNRDLHRSHLTVVGLTDAGPAGTMAVTAPADRPARSQPRHPPVRPSAMPVLRHASALDAPIRGWQSEYVPFDSPASLRLPPPRAIPRSAFHRFASHHRRRLLGRDKPFYPINGLCWLWAGRPSTRGRLSALRKYSAQFKSRFGVW